MGQRKLVVKTISPPLGSIDFPTEVPIEAQEVALGTVLVVALVVARVAETSVAIGGLPVDTVTGLKKLKIKVC